MCVRASASGGDGIEPAWRVVGEHGLAEYGGVVLKMGLVNLRGRWSTAYVLNFLFRVKKRNEFASVSNLVFIYL